MKKGFMMTLALLLVVFGAYFVSETYARYTEQVDKAGSATVAKWAFGTDNQGETITMKLDKTYHASSLVSEKIAPGTKGSFDIELSNATTETAVDVNVALTKENVPTNLKFYTNEECTDELTTEQFTAVIAAKQSLEKKTIYWKWNYNTDANETIDTADTKDGKTAKTMAVKLKITGTQKQPGTTEVRTEWNN